MKPTWKQADVLPIIAGIIKRAYRDHHRFVTAHVIIQYKLAEEKDAQ
jgi:putative N-acetylmannosamine-6-phosphate epimerase